MKISTLITLLQKKQKEGATEVWFSSDEEGNEIMTEAIADYNTEKAIVLYPYGPIVK